MSSKSQPQAQQNDPQQSNRMLAWQINSFGDLKDLQLYPSAKIPVLTKPNQVLIKVAAASVNPIDTAMLGNTLHSTLDTVCLPETTVIPSVRF